MTEHSMIAVQDNPIRRLSAHIRRVNSASEIESEEAKLDRIEREEAERARKLSADLLAILVLLGSAFLIMLIIISLDSAAIICTAIVAVCFAAHAINSFGALKFIRGMLSGILACGFLTMGFHLL